MLYMIGIGLSKKDIGVGALEVVRECDTVYLETYTSKIDATIVELEEFYKKSIIPADRALVEQNADQILEKAKGSNVAFLVMGDVFAATTHTDLKLRAFDKGIKVEVMHNTSVLTAIGETGLELYKFGKVTSIPYDNKNVTSPIQVMDANEEMDLHTLFLLDLRPEHDKYMSAREAADYLLSNDVADRMCVACAALGTGDAQMVYCKLKDVPVMKGFPQCLIVPGKLHFVEEEALKRIQA